jgi:hypothetical protein
MTPQKLKSYFIIDIVWVLVFVAFEITTKNDLAFLAISILIGSVMILGKQLSKASYIAQFLYWSAINIFKPKTKYNNWTWGIFIIFIGVMAFIAGTKKTSEEEALFQQLHQSGEFWLAMIVVIAFNIMVGIYTAKKTKKN